MPIISQIAQSGNSVIMLIMFNGLYTINIE